MIISQVSYRTNVGPVVSEKKIFEIFPHSKSMETINPRGVAKIDPRGMNGTIYVVLVFFLL